MIKYCNISIAKCFLFQAKFYRSKNSQIWSKGARHGSSNGKKRNCRDPPVDLLRSRVPQLWISGNRNQPGPPLSPGRHHQCPHRHPSRANNGAGARKRRAKVSRNLSQMVSSFVNPQSVHFLNIFQRAPEQLRVTLAQQQGDAVYTGGGENHGGALQDFLRQGGLRG